MPFYRKYSDSVLEEKGLEDFSFEWGEHTPGLTTSFIGENKSRNYFISHPLFFLPLDFAVLSTKSIS